MGKKSKRNRSKQEDGSSSSSKRVAPAQRKQNNKNEAETIENLQFEDPYVDEIEMEEEAVDDGADDDDEVVEDTATEYIQSWHPLMGSKEGEEQELEMDPNAYKMYHSLTPDWPSLSFDFIKDQLGESRQRFPHTLQAVIGSQADLPENNQLTVLQLSDLSKISKDDNESDDDDDDSDDDDSDDDDEDLDPILEHYHLRHYGGVNRIRSMPQKSNIVATWSDANQINLYDIESILQRFSRDSNTNSHGNNNNESDSDKRPFMTHDTSTEGFAMDWSTKEEGSLVTGDCNGAISLWKPNSSASSSFDVTDNCYQAKLNGTNVSVEDLQWSPTETTVFAAATCQGSIQIFDTRAPNRCMVSHSVTANNCDVNVISWNHLVTNLLASGSDDGTLSVWDLRQFGGGKGKGGASPTPLARFTAHSTPITSVEWHPTDESMLGITDDVGAYVYDLSVEEDAQTASQSSTQNVMADIPPQLLFCHAGSKLFKELHWHPQISSCIMTTA
eukprot:CAMPEP_0119572882 /NCGR_PEP_ID=MMETSP1352-20130426/44846_1 /TAXON_ID=265584 /ORGANISM="Stauroneis constricta, Strain CCMP1120" /LENGTH=500 /DNA_ID=CAMNT_0007622569 /DNA_START=18 /DNA_END=1516 /DNA_ORIENTATION=+